MSDRPVALVTGASSGIGEATAMALRKAGYEVFAAARRVERMRNLEKVGINTISLDVTEDASMRSAVNLVLEKAGRIDVLINNAGYGSYGALEDVPVAEARRQMEVNVFGLARMTQLVIPGMRERRSGVIVNISSVGGRFGEAFGAWYHATKYAIEGLSDSLALELAPFGIKVVVVEPGAIRTEWASNSAVNVLKTSGDGAYAEAARKKAGWLKAYNSIKTSSSPETVADGIVRILRKPHPKMRYAIGGGAKPVLALRRLTSDRLFYRVVGKFID